MSNRTSLRGYQLVADLKSSLIAGLAGSQSPNSLSPTCTSGNCTFEVTEGITHSTAGLRSECIDVTSFITQSGAHSWEKFGAKSAATTNYSVGVLTLKYNVTDYSPRDSSRWDTILMKTGVMDRFNNFSMLDNLTMTQRRREIVQNSSFDGILFLMPTTNPREDPADYQKYISDWENIPMPPVKASHSSTCPAWTPSPVTFQ